MKTFFKSALVACIALATMLVGCSKEEGIAENGDTKTVTIKIHREGVATKAPGIQVNDGSEITLNDASLYFTDGTVVVARYDIDVDGEGADTGDVAMSELDGQINGSVDGKTFSNLPANIDNVYFVGNSPISYAVSDMSEFTKATAITLASQTTITNVALYGGTAGAGLGAGVTANGKTTYGVQFLVKPVVARLEIGNIAANWTTAPYVSTITEFNLKGIFIDNHYTTMGIAGAAGATFVTKPTIASTATEAEIITANETKYVAGNYANMSDVEGFVKINPGVKGFPGWMASDEEHAVWAYNMLAATGAAAPRIVIRLDGVKIKNALGEEDAVSYAGTKYLTVGSIKDQHTKEIITTIEAGKIYRISNLSFAQGHLTDIPNIGQIDIEVEVEIMKWDVIDVDHIFE